MDKKETLNQITDIKNMMEKSSRFLSLSGLSGISAGLIALAGSVFAFFYLDFNVRYFDINNYFTQKLYLKIPNSIYQLGLIALIILVLSFISIIYFSSKKARKQGLKAWDSTAKRLLYHLMVPLATGGLFCIILFYHRIVFLIAPATLIFYGLALLNASKFTLHEIQWLGISEIILGLIATLFIGYGIVFWSLGFGVLHIVYGGVMYYRYERNN